MLKHDHEHYAKHAKIITDEKNREAFWYLVAFAAALKDFECEIRFSGSGKRSFKFYWRGRKKHPYPFSFIINKGIGHLFYIRSPAINKGIINKSQVLDEFKDLETEDKGKEISIRIDNPSVAARITKYVFDPSSR